MFETTTTRQREERREEERREVEMREAGWMTSKVTRRSITPFKPILGTANSADFNNQQPRTRITPTFAIGGQWKLKSTPVKSNDFIASFDYDPNKAESFLDATLSSQWDNDGEEDRRLAEENARFGETKRTLNWSGSKGGAEGEGMSIGSGKNKRRRTVVGAQVGGGSGIKGKRPSAMNVLAQKALEFDSGEGRLRPFSFTGGGSGFGGGRMIMTPPPNMTTAAAPVNPYVNMGGLAGIGGLEEQGGRGGGGLDDALENAFF